MPDVTQNDVNVCKNLLHVNTTQYLFWIRVSRWIPSTVNKSLFYPQEQGWDTIRPTEPRTVSLSVSERERFRVSQDDLMTHIRKGVLRTRPKEFTTDSLP